MASLTSSPLLIPIALAVSSVESQEGLKLEALNALRRGAVKEGRISRRVETL